MPSRASNAAQPAREAAPGAPSSSSRPMPPFLSSALRVGAASIAAQPFRPFLPHPQHRRPLAPSWAAMRRAALGVDASHPILAASAARPRADRPASSQARREAITGNDLCIAGGRRVQVLGR